MKRYLTWYRLLLLAGGMMLAAWPAHAQLYQCADDAGKIIIRDTPCYNEKMLNFSNVTPADYHYPKPQQGNRTPAKSSARTPSRNSPKRR